MKKILVKLILAVTILGIAAAAALLFANNRPAERPRPEELRASLEAVIGWVDANREAILKQSNPVLWWMVQHSAEHTGDPRLQALFADYHARYLDNPRNLWVPLFYPGRWVPFRIEDIAHYPDYNLHFIYGIGCDAELAEHPVVAPQLRADFCDRYPLRPACVTHQLMGFRFMQLSGCGDPAATSAAVSELQTRIVRQLTWDPRVVDVYVQRVLMLVESGAAERVKPIWLRRVLDAQRADGGWAGIDPLLELGSAASVSFGPRGLAFGPPRSDFHATAQGLLLMSLLTQPASGTD